MPWFQDLLFFLKTAENIIVFMWPLFLFKTNIAGSLEAAYLLNWGAQKICGKGGGETLAVLW